MTIAEDLEKLRDYIEKKELEEEQSGKKEKKFKIPFGKKVSKTQRAKNYVTVVLMNDNWGVEFKKVPIDEQTIMVDLIPRLATAGHIMYYKKNPMIFLPKWSVEPFSPKQHFENSLENGSNVKGYSILLNRMKKETVQQKKPLGNAVKWILGGGLALVIVWAFLSGGGT